MDYSLGGQEKKQTVNEGIADIPQNKTLFVQKMTSDPPPFEVVNGLKTMKDIFNHFKPEVDVAFEKPDGTQEQETLAFSKVWDFSKAGLIEQSETLKEMRGNEIDGMKFLKQLQSNKVLHGVAQDPEKKAAYVAALKELLGELGGGDDAGDDA